MNQKVILSGRELDIMKILWKKKEPLTASEISKIGSLSINTVQVMLRNLLANNYIEVGDIGYSGTVLSRKYQAVLKADAFIKENILEYSNLKDSLKVFASLIEEETDVETISKLETLLKERKAKLKLE